MLKVLIADDEPKIRRGLAQSVEWESVGMSVCGFANNGLAAIHAVDEKKPDICLVDICMPILNGLELIEKIHELNPRTVCIVITGYDEFEYAQKAVKIGVFDYILKPVNEKQLMDTLMRVKEYLEKRSSQEKWLEQAEIMLKKSIPYLQERLLNDIVTGVIVEEELEEALKVHGMEFQNSVAFFRLFVVEGVDQTEGKLWDRKLLHFAVRNIAREILGQNGAVYMGSDSLEHLIIAVDWENPENLTEVKDRIQTSISEYLKIQVDIRATVVNKLIQIPEIYEAWREEDRRNLSGFVSKAKRYLDETYMNADISVQEVARICGVNPSYLSRVFKAEMGVNVVDYLTKIRMQTALDLLIHTDMMIYEIAEEVGYKSQHYFCTAFKKVLDIAPSEYRQSIRK